MEEDHFRWVGIGKGGCKNKHVDVPAEADCGGTGLEWKVVSGQNQRTGEN